MPDIKKIKNYYEYLKSTDVKLLPLEKIISLENSKEELIDRYLTKIEKINPDYQLTTKTDFSLNDILLFCQNYFGTLNFSNQVNEDNKITLTYAFNFCLLNLDYVDHQIKYKVNVYWDI